MIEPYADVRAFFHERVVRSLKDRRLQTTTETEQYLVELLASFAGPAVADDLEQPLVLLLCRASEASGPERLAAFRRLGDVALFVCGFLAETLERRGVTQRYVTALGGHAYWTSRLIAKGSASQRAAEHEVVFAELADKFQRLALVLDDVREQTTLRTDGHLLRLYERWLHSRSPRLAARLHALGVFPTGGSAKPTLN